MKYKTRRNKSIKRITSVEKEGNEMIITRTFDAPRDLVFEVHSDCSHLMRWWGGRKWPLVKCGMDYREGGEWSYCMELPDGNLTCGLAIYQEIIRPGKIAYKDHFLDEEGKISKDMPSSLISFEFAEENGNTRVVNRWEYPTDTDLEEMIEMGAVEGLTEIWDRLHHYLIELETNKEEQQ